VLVLSQYVEPLYRASRCRTATAASGTGSRTGWPTSAGSSTRAAGSPPGGTAIDPEVIAQLLTRQARNEPLGQLTAREREVPGPMAEGRSNAAIAGRLFIIEKAAGKQRHLRQARPAPSEADNRRVLAVLAYLNA
jgi:hypothetical protein